MEPTKIKASDIIDKNFNKDLSKSVNLIKKLTDIVDDKLIFKLMSDRWKHIKADTCDFQMATPEMMRGCPNKYVSVSVFFWLMDKLEKGELEIKKSKK
ncbi:MAG: hypothetical protein V4547_18930 [Bacteroidota bacterium]